MTRGAGRTVTGPLGLSDVNDLALDLLRHLCLRPGFQTHALILARRASGRPNYAVGVRGYRHYAIVFALVAVIAYFAITPIAAIVVLALALGFLILLGSTRRKQRHLRANEHRRRRIH